MKIDAPEIVALRNKVRAARDEFDSIIAFHETWRPAADDETLHQRVGYSYAAQTFRIVRTALRREVLLGLMRLWDDDKRSVGMSSIANTLCDKRVIAALAAETAAQWGALPEFYTSDIPENERDELRRAAEESEKAFGRQMGEELGQRATEAVAIIRRYEDGATKHGAFQMLKTLRDEHLAHLQVKPTSAGDHDDFDEKVEAFYQDMITVIRLLMHVVLKTSYEPTETAEVFQHYAKFFWAGVSGERTKGHPNYKPPPNSKT